MITCLAICANDNLQLGRTVSHCCCMDCRESDQWVAPPGMTVATFLRYGCEVCGDKKCPHHRDHRLACKGHAAAPKERLAT